jgi:simple sugar transport system substrate-binding protein
MRKLWLVSLVVALLLVAGLGFAAPKKTIVMVVKLEGVAWFDNMRLGIQAFAKDYPDVDAYQTGA